MERRFTVLCGNPLGGQDRVGGGRLLPSGEVEAYWGTKSASFYPSTSELLAAVRAVYSDADISFTDEAPAPQKDLSGRAIDAALAEAGSLAMLYQRRAEAAEAEAAGLRTAFEASNMQVTLMGIRTDSVIARAEDHDTQLAQIQRQVAEAAEWKRRAEAAEARAAELEAILEAVREENGDLESACAALKEAGIKGTIPLETLKELLALRHGIEAALTVETGPNNKSAREMQRLLREALEKTSADRSSTPG